MSAAVTDLRDARHLNKFLYTMRHSLFYEPFARGYEPSGQYREAVEKRIEEMDLPWSVDRDGLWFHVHPREMSQDELPAQGWKIHVSATLDNAEKILEKTIQIALGNETPFKFALDPNIVSLMSSKAWARGGSGKFITIYPADRGEFEDLLESLYDVLRDDEGPYILSDKRYRDCKVLYYRYGGIRRVTRLEPTGKKTPVLRAPDGELVPDVRTPYFQCPDWEEDPFPGEEGADGAVDLGNGRYEVHTALSFSNSGGVYLADDRETGDTVVIKEARAHTLMDGKGGDAIQLLKREEAILDLLAGTGAAPEKVDSFQTWENYFLVQEYLDTLSIREIMLSRSPLLQVNPTEEESREYFEVYRDLFMSFTERLGMLHDKGVVFGDLSANNLKVEEGTWSVQFIDFEGAFREGVDEPTFLFTPGFKSEESVRNDEHGAHEDHYSLAAVMLYLMFPIAALGSLREDLFDDVLEVVLRDLGWAETGLDEIIRGLAQGELDCPAAHRRLAELDVADVEAPGYRTDVDLATVDRRCRRLGDFLQAHLDPGGEHQLIPADPFMHSTNALGLGFGASGVLFALQRSGMEVPPAALDWLRDEVRETPLEDLAPGILTGAAGIAWCLAELGLEDLAEEALSAAHESPLLTDHPSFFYGLGGVGMVDLYFHRRTGRGHHLEAALEVAETLRRQAHIDEETAHWQPAFGEVQVGFGYGQSGVALFLLRLYQVTGDESWLDLGQRALAYDLSHATQNEDGVTSFPGRPESPTLLAYLEEGSAGIAKVALRYAEATGAPVEGLDEMLASVHRKYATYPGLLYGLCSYVDVLVDAHRFTGEERYLEMTRRPLAGLHDLYLLERPEGLATPGDSLFRVSCDYATGVAGVMRTLHRVTHLGEADFFLDGLGEAASASTDQPLALAS